MRGVPLHVHHHQDEWWYILTGEYLFQIGDRRIRAKVGDAVFAPRGVPHSPLRLSQSSSNITLFQPAGTMEEFFHEVAKLRPGTGQGVAVESMGELFRAHGMEIVGPADSSLTPQKHPLRDSRTLAGSDLNTRRSPCPQKPSRNPLPASARSRPRSNWRRRRGIGCCAGDCSRRNSVSPKRRRPMGSRQGIAGGFRCLLPTGLFPRMSLTGTSPPHRAMCDAWPSLGRRPIPAASP